MIWISALSDVDFCEYKFYHKYVLKTPETETNSMKSGTINHYNLSKNPNGDNEVWIKYKDVRGKIDHIGYSGNTLRVVEYKSNKNGEVYESQKIQVAAYCYLLKKELPLLFEKYEKVQCVIRRIGDLKVLYESDYTPLKEIDIEKKLEKVNYILTGAEIPEKATNKNKCAKCGYKDVCW